MRAVLRDTLTDGGYLVVTASDLGEAVSRAKESPPDLLITRPYINSMSGKTAAEYLRGRHHGLPVLIIAGCMDDDRVCDEHAIDEFHTFPKPFTREELLDGVRHVMEIVRPKSAAMKNRS